MLTAVRRIVDILIVLGALGLVGGVAAWQIDQQQQRQALKAVADTVRDFDRMIRLRAATKDVELNARGWPVTIDPKWFDGNPPRNPLVTPDRPWVDIAPPEDARLTNPAVRIAVSRELASFWYNPYQGIIRARVPVSISDQRALELYNTINGTDLDVIFPRGDELNTPPEPPKPEAPAAQPTLSTPDGAFLSPPDLPT